MKNLLIIGHDANRAGAQLVLLNLMRRLNEAGGFRMHLLLGEGGPLLDEYRAICPVTLWPAPDRYVAGALTDKVLGKLGLWQQFYDRLAEQRQRKVRAQLGLDTIDVVLVNTVTSSRWFEQLALPEQTPVVTFVHELALAVRMYTQPDELAYLLRRTSRLLAVSKATARYYEQEHGFDPARITLFTLIDTSALERNVKQARAQPGPYVALGLPPDARIVGGCGNAEWRKGNDLFVTLARQIISPIETRKKIGPDVYFVWVGVPPGALRDDLQADIRKAGIADRVHLIPPTPEVLRYTSRFDVFVLCSREDPYPLVVFEAGLSGVSVVCFDGAGGSPELVENDGGFVVPYLDLDALRDRVLTLLGQPDLCRTMGERLGQKIRERHPAEQSIETLVSLLSQPVTE